jgi:hypothetical protein
MSIIHESFPLFIQPIHPAPASAPASAPAPAPASASASLASEALQPAMDIHAPLTEPLLRKRPVHEVAHGVPFSDPKRPKSFHS